jgi:hypothetical protein
MIRSLIISFIITALTFSSAQAQPSPSIELELNKSETVNGACRITFVAHNALGKPIEALELDLVIFDQSETVVNYAAIDFGALSPDKTRVRQYDMASGSCDDIARILVNDIRLCEFSGEKNSPCLDLLQLRTRTNIDFIF